MVSRFIHILVLNSEAESIAGTNLAVTDAKEVVFAFALW